MFLFFYNYIVFCYGPVRHIARSITAADMLPPWSN